MKRTINIDKIEDYFNTNLKIISRECLGGVTTAAMIKLIEAGRRIFGQMFTVQIGKKPLGADTNSSEVTRIIRYAQEHYDELVIKIDLVKLFRETGINMSDVYSKIVFMYDEDLNQWIKTFQYGIETTRDFIFEVRLVQRVCSELELDLNDYSFHTISKMYLNKTGV